MRKLYHIQNSDIGVDDKFLTHLKPYCVSLPTQLDKAQGADEGGAREGIYIERLNSPVNGPRTDKEHFFVSPFFTTTPKTRIFNHMSGARSAKRASLPSQVALLSSRSSMSKSSFLSTQLGLQVQSHFGGKDRALPAPVPSRMRGIMHAFKLPPFSRG